MQSTVLRHGRLKDPKRLTNPHVTLTRCGLRIRIVGNAVGRALIRQSIRRDALRNYAKSESIWSKSAVGPARNWPFVWVVRFRGIGCRRPPRAIRSTREVDVPGPRDRSPHPRIEPSRRGWGAPDANDPTCVDIEESTRRFRLSRRRKSVL